MKKILLSLSALGLLTAALQAAPATYPSLNVDYSTPGSTATSLTTGLIAIDPAHVFFDSNGGDGAVDPALTRYYSGTITMGGSITSWHSYASVNFFSSADAALFQVGVQGGDNKLTIHKNAWNETVVPTPNVTTGTFHFQIKVQDQAWGGNTISLFWGANAIAETEGTPNAVWASSSIGDSIAKMSVTFDATGVASAFSFATTNMTSDTAWIAPAPAEQVLTTIEPAGGSYVGPQTVTISAVPSSSTIHFTTDGSTPTTSSPVYSGPFTVSTTGTIVKALGVKSGLTDSLVAEQTYYLAAGAPTFSPAGGSFTASQNVTLSSVPVDAAIYYTTDGSDPDNVGNGTLYTGPIALSSGSTVIRAIAYKGGLDDSTISQATYTFAVTAPVFSPPGGTYASAQNISISAAPGTAAIYYTTDGSEPNNVGNGTLYTGPVAVSDTTLKAIAYQAGYDDSPVATADYVIDSTILALWDVNDISGGNPANLAANSSAAGIVPGSLLERGAGYNAGYLWNTNNGFDTQNGSDAVDLAEAITDEVYAKFTVAPSVGQKVMFSDLSFYATTSSGNPTTFELLFSQDGFATPGTSVGSVVITNGMNGQLVSFDVTGVAALQNCTVATEFRCYFYGTNGYEIRGLGGFNVHPTIIVRGTTAPTGGANDYAAWALANGVTGGVNGDSDNDGVKNLVEYALADGAERGTFNATTNNLSFTKRGGLYGSDITYAIEESTNLINWTVVAEPPVINNAGSISYTLSGGTTKFARLKVTQP